MSVACMLGFEVIHMHFSPQMVTLLHCQDRVCAECVSRYITITIKDKNILHLVCPVCGEPKNLDDEAVATDYFNNFDILVKSYFNPFTPRSIICYLSSSHLLAYKAFTKHFHISWSAAVFKHHTPRSDQ